MLFVIVNSTFVLCSLDPLFLVVELFSELFVFTLQFFHFIFSVVLLTLVSIQSLTIDWPFLFCCRYNWRFFDNLDDLDFIVVVVLDILLLTTEYKGGFFSPGFCSGAGVALVFGQKLPSLSTEENQKGVITHQRDEITHQGDKITGILLIVHAYFWSIKREMRCVRREYCW